jgi:protein-disulfide isomerase
MRAPRVVYHEPQTEEQKREERVENLIAVLVILVVVVVGTILFVHWLQARHALPQENPDTRYTLSIGENPLLGRENASVTIIEFADYECAACAAFYQDVFPKIKAAYIDTGKVRFAFRDYPIEAMHPEAFAAAISARCAREQGKYWAFHDALYAAQGQLSDQVYNETAARLGLNVTQLNDCRSAGTYDAEVRTDYLEGLNQGRVAATPTFFINGKRLVGNQPFETFQGMIEAELQRLKG